MKSLGQFLIVLLQPAAPEQEAFLKIKRYFEVLQNNGEKNYNRFVR